MTDLRISGIAYQPHVAITNTERLGASLILRIPEFVKPSDDARPIKPGKVVWESVEPERHLRYRWCEDEPVKQRIGIDFHGEVRARAGALDFQVTMRNLGSDARNTGMYLFCLQTGALYAFPDYEGQRTFVVDAHKGWTSVHEMQEGVFETHRMCGYDIGPEGVAHPLMAKIDEDGDWVLGIALDRSTHVSCNHQLWPSCIHANPAWPMLAPNQEATVHGKVYFFRGGLDALLDRFQNDFTA